MATMVCHPHLQPCVDSQFIDTTWPHIKFTSKFPPSLQFAALNSRFLDLDPPKSPTHRNDLNHNDTNSVLPPSDDAAIADAKSPMPNEETESGSYVHPLVKRSRSTLDEKSLAICTENLGSETGAADFAEDSVFYDLKTERSPTRKRTKSVNNRGNNKLFPPPLTTIAGPDSICVQSYRENGRLMMAAVESRARLSCFVAERSHGRLRLSILKSCEVESGEEISAGNEIETRNDDVEVVGEDGNCEKDVGGKVEENGSFGGVEIEMEKFERPCRCNDGGENNNIVKNINGSEMVLFTREPLSIWVSTTS